MTARGPVKTSNPYGALTATTACTDNAPRKVVTPTNFATANDDKKKRKKKKKRNSTTSNDGSAFDGGDGADTKDGSETTSEQLQAPQLSLEQRLEIAATHADLHAALVGLVGWSRLYMNTDTILTFFQCNALQLLFTNVITSRGAKLDTIVYDLLSAFLANCLCIERNGKRSTSSHEVATAVVDALRAVVVVAHQLPLPEDSENGYNDDPVATQKIAAHLSKLVLQYRLSLNGVTLESELSQQVVAIDGQLASAAAKDSAVKGQTIRDSFQRRDIRSDAMSMYDKRLAAITKLVASDHTHGNNRADSKDEHGAFSWHQSDDQEEEENNQVNPEEEEEVAIQLSHLNGEKAATLAPVKEKLHQQEDDMVSLAKQREELEEKLRRVNAQIQCVAETQDSLLAQVDSIEKDFESKTCELDAKQKKFQELHRRNTSKEQIKTELATLETAIQAISTAHSEVQTLREKQIVCLRQQLEGALRYFDSELPCIKFMAARAKETELEMGKLLEEAKGYEALGVDAVAQELVEKADAMRIHVDEDKLAVATLKARDLQVAAMVEKIFEDPVHREALAQVDDDLKKEALRQVEYVKAIHTTSTNPSDPGMETI